jgi:hypothetical protein
MNNSITKIKPGTYKIDIACRNGKSYLYDGSMNILFESTNLKDIFAYIKSNSTGYENLSMYEVKIW